VRNPHLLNVNVLYVFLYQGNDQIAKDSRLPKHPISRHIPSLNVCATPIIIWCDVTNALINDRLDLWRSLPLGMSNCWRKPRQKDQNRDEIAHNANEANAKTQRRRATWQRMQTERATRRPLK